MSQIKILKYYKVHLCLKGKYSGKYMDQVKTGFTGEWRIRKNRELRELFYRLNILENITKKRFE